MEFYTDKYYFRQMGKGEISQLEVGEKVVVLVSSNIPKSMVFENAVVTGEIRKEGAKWGIETDRGFVNIINIYEVRER